MKKFVYMILITFLLLGSSFADNLDLDDYFNQVINSLANEENGWVLDELNKDIVPTFDFDNNLNGAICNLTKDGEEKGYIIINILDNNFDLEQFSYTGKYDKIPKELEKSKLIKVGFDLFYNSSLLKINDINESAEIQRIKRYNEEFKYVVEENIANKKSSNQLRANSDYDLTVKNLYGNPSATGGLRYNFLPLTMKQFTSDNSENFCVPLASLNLLRYWKTRRGVDNIIYRDGYTEAFRALDNCIPRIPVIDGSVAALAKDGTKKYLRDYGLTMPAGEDVKVLYGLEDFIKRNINNSNPLVVTLRPGAKDVKKEIIIGTEFLQLGMVKVEVGNIIEFVMVGMLILKIL